MIFWGKWQMLQAGLEHYVLKAIQLLKLQNIYVTQKSSILLTAK